MSDAKSFLLLSSSHCSLCDLLLWVFVLRFSKNRKLLLLPTLHFAEMQLSLERFLQPASRFQTFLENISSTIDAIKSSSICHWTLNLASLCHIF